jgi:predicted nuclease of restriction endonuclease-like (RecB) superfamily
MSKEIADNQLFGKIAELIELARKKVATTVNLTMVHTYYEIGRMIVEDEQQGKERAEYGKAILKDLSKRLSEKFGKGFSIDNLQNVRRFYKTYSKYETPSRNLQSDENMQVSISQKPSSELQSNIELSNSIRQTLSSELQRDENKPKANSATPLRKSDNSNQALNSISSILLTKLENVDKQLDTISQNPSSKLQNINKKQNSIQQTPSTKSHDFTLGWSHYLILMRIENPAERSFYEIEAFNQSWSERQLKRQYHSSLYERLALSRNKEEIMKLANEGHSVVKPEDILNNPLSLEFLGLEEKFSYSESDMELAIISKLQQFLLELGKGFLFEARQKRFTFDDKHFFVDLVFYNRLLQCYVLIDLKTDELVHQDLGQMQMYVNYYDRFVKLDYEKPTIGILLCKKKNDAIVELTLPKDANIYASEYSLYLPEKQLLQQKLTEWLLEYENIIEDKI